MWNLTLKGHLLCSFSGSYLYFEFQLEGLHAFFPYFAPEYTPVLILCFDWSEHHLEVIQP